MEYLHPGEEKGESGQLGPAHPAKYGPEQEIDYRSPGQGIEKFGHGHLEQRREGGRVGDEPPQHPQQVQQSKDSGGTEQAGKTKASTYKKTKEYAAKFQEINGSVYCKELKGVATGKILAPCDKCILDAVELAEQFLEEN